MSDILTSMRMQYVHRLDVVGCLLLQSWDLHAIKVDLQYVAILRVRRNGQHQDMRGNLKSQRPQKDALYIQW